MSRCLNPSNITLPHDVSLTEDPCRPPQETLKILYLRSSKPEEKHWCLTSLFNSPKMTVKETEFLKKKLDVEKTTFYAMHNMNSRKLEVLSWKSFVKWKLPISKQDILYYGQCAAINDCLYKNLFTAKMIVFITLRDLLFNDRQQVSIDKNKKYNEKVLHAYSLSIEPSKEISYQTVYNVTGSYQSAFSFRLS